MATYDAWLPALISRLPGATVSNIKRELVAVIREFSRDALPWQELTDTYAVAAEEESIKLNPVDNRSECIFVVHAYWGEYELAPMAWKPSSATYPGFPLAYTCESAPDTVTFIPTPSEGIEDFRAVIALAPKDPSVWLPDLFVSHYQDVILDGVLGRFMNQPFKPYTDERKAAFHLKRYRNKTIEARVIAKRGNTPDGQQWAFPRFGA